MKRNDGPASSFIDSTEPSLVYRPVAYSSMINGMDHSHKKQNQTIRNTSAPKVNTIRMYIYERFICSSSKVYKCSYIYVAKILML